jgi:glucosamine kinase
MQLLFVGVDGGGTKTKIQIENAEGKVLATARSGPANIKTSAQQAWQSIKQGINEAAKEAKLDLQAYQVHVGLGLAGVEVPAARDIFLSMPHPYASLLLDSDAYVACLGVHGGKDGAIIIIGTGVNGYMVENGKRIQVNGWGFPHTDEGGGAWLGIEAVRLCFKAIDGRIPFSRLLRAIYHHFNEDLPKFVTWANQASPSDFGSIAPIVIEHADKDPHANYLLAQAAREIDLIAMTLQRRSAHKDKPLACGLLGGVAPFIEPRLSDKVKSWIVPRQFDATKGAVLMIRNKILAKA